MAKAKRLTEADVEFVIHLAEEDTPVRGNVLALGKEKADREAEDEILRRLDQGDIWAWAQVTVEARYHGLSGCDSLGCCSYQDADDFRQSYYFDSLKSEALADLQRQIDDLIAVICE